MYIIIHMLHVRPILEYCSVVCDHQSPCAKKILTALRRYSGVDSLKDYLASNLCHKQTVCDVLV